MLDEIHISLVHEIKIFEPNSCKISTEPLENPVC